MKVLIACEYSGIVRDAFIKLGHDAISCDILPTESPGPHYQGDVLNIDIINNDFDLMIAHPPCTYLCVAGFHYSLKSSERMKKTKKAMQFFLSLYNSNIEKICIENPVGYINTNYRKPDQIIHPYYFGDRELKKTCLWLKNLFPLQHWNKDNLFFKQTHTEKPVPTKTIIRKTGSKAGQKYNYYWRQGRTGHERSKTFPGIAEAMAIQWGNNN